VKPQSNVDGTAAAKRRKANFDEMTELS